MQRNSSTVRLDGNAATYTNDSAACVGKLWHQVASTTFIIYIDCPSPLRLWCLLGMV